MTPRASTTPSPSGALHHRVPTRPRLARRVRAAGISAQFVRFERPGRRRSTNAGATATLAHLCQSRGSRPIAGRLHRRLGCADRFNRIRFRTVWANRRLRARSGGSQRRGFVPLETRGSGRTHRVWARRPFHRSPECCARSAGRTDPPAVRGSYGASGRDHDRNNHGRSDHRQRLDPSTSRGKMAASRSRISRSRDDRWSRRDLGVLMDSRLARGDRSASRRLGNRAYRWIGSTQSCHFRQ